MKEKMLTFLPKTKRQWMNLLVLAALVVTFCVMAVPVMADGVDPTEIVMGLLDIVFTIFLYIGIMLAVWGAGMLILAFKNEDADSKTKAMMTLVVAVCLIAIKFLLEDTGVLQKLLDSTKDV